MMRKQFFRMLNMLLLLGSSMMLLTACGDKDEDEPKSYVVNFAVVLPRTTANYFDVILTLTDGNGNVTTTTVSKDSDSEALTSVESRVWTDLFTPYTETDTLSVTAENFQDNIVVHAKVKGASGHQVQYEAVTKARHDYQAQEGQTLVFPVLLAYFVEKTENVLSINAPKTMHIYEHIDDMQAFVAEHDSTKVRKGKVTLP